MVQKRTMSAIILTLFLIVVLAINNRILDSIVVTALSIIAMYEYNHALKEAGHKPIPLVGYCSCLLILTMGLGINTEVKYELIKFGLPILFLGLYVYVILTNMKHNIVDISLTLFSIFYIPMLFSFFKSILLFEQGRLIIWYVITGAFVSDVFAFLIGRKYGKRKLCEKISPKKTVEGAVAGVVSVVIVYVIMTILFNKIFDLEYNILLVAVLGVVASILGQFGDLTASTIKRYANVKDYGNILPGHGGILDRFDSILFVAPVVYIFFKIYLGI